MTTKAITMVLLAALTTVACATSAPDEDGRTKITGARVSNDGTGGVTVSGEEGTYEYDDTGAVQTDLVGSGQSSNGIGIRQKVGCQIQHCDNCTCGEGGCTCTGCTCVAR